MVYLFRSVGSTVISLLMIVDLCLPISLSLFLALFVQITAIQIPQKTAMLVLSVGSAFFLFWLFQGVFWWTIFSSGFLVALHAFLRDASMHKDLDDVMAMEGDLGGVVGGEDASFLNSNV